MIYHKNLIILYKIFMDGSCAPEHRSISHHRKGRTSVGRSWLTSWRSFFFGFYRVLTPSGQMRFPIASHVLRYTFRVITAVSRVINVFVCACAYVIITVRVSIHVAVRGVKKKKKKTINTANRVLFSHSTCCLLGTVMCWFREKLMRYYIDTTYTRVRTDLCSFSREISTHTHKHDLYAYMHTCTPTTTFYKHF
jgi:hypothetical protein